MAVADAGVVRTPHEWEAGPGVLTPELAATWARLEVWVGDECVSQVEDLAAGSIRRSIYVAMYPLAEWVAYNWWFLSAHTRVAAVDRTRWMFSSLGKRPQTPHSWLRHHNMRAAGDGFFWPDLTFLPEGAHTRLAWWADPAGHPRHGSVRGIAEGELLIRTEEVLESLADLVESVLVRLEEQGIDHSPLHEEWESLKQADEDEAEFCLASARLGLDPYSEGQTIGDTIEKVSAELEYQLFVDFVESVDPQRIDQGFQWVKAGSARIDENESAPHDVVAEMRTAAEGFPIGAEPWQSGWGQARSVRPVLEVSAHERIDLAAVVAVDELPSQDASLQGITGSSAKGSSVVVVGRPMVEDARNFARGRALWHLIFEPDAHALLTAAHAERQKQERAFAAELLAPADGVREHLEVADGVVAQEELERVGSLFGVSSFVIRHQVENQLNLDVARL